jgi:hypothetical protein
MAVHSVVDLVLEDSYTGAAWKEEALEASAAKDAGTLAAVIQAVHKRHTDFGLAAP